VASARRLRYWLKLAEPNLRPSTVHSYRDHIERYLIPSLGRITLADLTPRRLRAAFDLLARLRTRQGTPVAASTVDRILATLRSALNAAVREGLIAGNPLAQVRITRPVRPHPVIWTDERVAAWPSRRRPPRRRSFRRPPRC
jgi:site-specific recombinase XerD